MLPPALMLAIKKRGMVLLNCLVLLLLCACGPPGPRALLKGQQLIQEGKYPQAVASLQKATRLLPKNAQAYNHLGLALHGNRQFTEAQAAYQKALALDHKLAAARYNLGCLYLEQNEALQAIEQLTSYTLVQPNSAEGWLKLGEAQLRARQPDAAEKSLKLALALRPRDPEVLNGLGVVQVQRKRFPDALSLFNNALAQNPKYGPALLNVAVLSQQQLNKQQFALEKYRNYLALQPRPANWEAVSAIARSLDAELNPPPVLRVTAPQTNASPPAATKTNMTLVQSNPPARTPTNHAAPVLAAITRTNVNVSSAPAPKATAAQTNQPATNPFVVATVKAPAAEPPKPPPPPVATDKPPDVEVTRLPDELVVKPPQEILVSRSPVLSEPGTAEVLAANPTNPASLVVVNKSEAKPDKRSLLSRLNPFGGRPKPGSKDSALDSPPAVITPLVTSNVIVVAARTPSPAPGPVIARYTYLSPAKPAPGNRREAEKFFAEGIKAQQANKPAAALAAYQRATDLDPAYFEAFYNGGLAAYGTGRWKESLSNYEHALAIKPNSVDARYNFALALQQGGYPQDAADELLEVLNENPAETRAHLLLANLCAQQLNQPKVARQHYLRVLECEPRHPKAPEIRYWLAANP